MLTLLALGGMLGFFWIRESRRSRKIGKEGTTLMLPLGLPSIADLPSAALLAQTEGSFWLPPPASTDSATVDNLFYILLGVTVFFFTLIVVADDRCS